MNTQTMGNIPNNNTYTTAYYATTTTITATINDINNTILTLSLRQLLILLTNTCVMFQISGGLCTFLPHYRAHCA